jgi:peptidoglycan/LPS O-acetylase OafA/YrhL
MSQALQADPVRLRPVLTAPRRDAGVERRAGESKSTPKLGYRPALDGIRALAVVAVFAYHAGLPWARAGFLGVDVFFVLSGYLITSVLLTERRRQGRIDLLRFWMRRARRLLPAVVVLLAAVAVTVPILAPDQSYRLRGDLLAALAYVSNWQLIFTEHSYFQSAGRPPILQHLWSLAVEEQFYLLWPPVLVVALRSRPYRRIAKPLLLAAVASAVLMALLYKPYTDPSRVYFGTDTRALALLIGAALAAATVRWNLVDRIRDSGRAMLDAAGLVALAALVWAVSHADEFDPRLYRGGFVVVALLSAALVAAAARPGQPMVLGRALGTRPMVWLGRRSYSVYLWFWPVLMLTRPQLDVSLTGTPLLALRIGLTLVLAAASYRFVECPARAGALGRMWADIRRAWRTRTPIRRRTAAWGLAFSVTLACVGVGLAVGDRTMEPVAVEAATGLNSAAVAKVGTALPSTTAVTAPAVLPATTVPAPTTTAVPVTTTTVPPTTVATVAAAPVVTIPSSLPALTASVTAIGDSVLLGAKPLLEHQIDGVVVDAEVARQFSSVLTTIRSYRDAGTLGSAVVIQTGNNGPFSASQFDQMMGLLRDVKRVVVVNVKVDRPWQDNNNNVIAEGVPRWPNAALVDWHALATARPDAFVDDGLHLTSAGVRLLTAAILAALQA